MKLSEIKKHLESLEAVKFMLPNGKFVPKNFHVTEVGLITKNFIDCGGTVRKETVVNFQLWNANDYEHRLKPRKLLDIIALSEKILGIEDYAIEVEYLDTTIGKYDLEFDGVNFLLRNKETACLAMDKCNIPQENDTSENTSCCAPGGGCC